MKKRFSEEQIIGFLRKAETCLPVKDLCCRHGFSEGSYYLWQSWPSVAARWSLARASAQNTRPPSARPQPTHPVDAQP